MIPVSALLPEQLCAQLALHPPFRGEQLFGWLHRKLAFDFEQMSDLPRQLRQSLAGQALPVSLRPEERLSDPDGTLKMRFIAAGRAAIEAVLLEDRGGGRKTACLSTQTGCGMGCRFCRTGLLGGGRDLSAAEIVDQLRLLQAWAGPVANVVFMGMGEPLANLANLRQAVSIFLHPAGSAMSRRRLTGGIRRLAREGPHLRLAVSLISARQELREALMPVARANPLAELREALLHYQRVTGQRVTLEVVLLEGVNDTERDARAIVGYLRPPSGPGLRALVNLLAWNPVPELPYRRPSPDRVKRFARELESAGVAVTTRLSRGGAVWGACGQLSAAPYPAAPLVEQQ
jgi:23S rRNA (adenine2503-C2)-methyltransferase